MIVNKLEEEKEEEANDATVATSTRKSLRQTKRPRTIYSEEENSAGGVPSLVSCSSSNDGSDDVSVGYYKRGKVIQRPRKRKGNGEEALAKLREGKTETMTRDQLLALRKEVRMARNRASAERTRLRRMRYTQNLEKQISVLKNQTASLIACLTEFCEGHGDVTKAYEIMGEVVIKQREDDEIAKSHKSQEEEVNNRDDDELDGCKDLADAHLLFSGPVVSFYYYYYYSLVLLPRRESESFVSKSQLFNPRLVKVSNASFVVDVLLLCGRKINKINNLYALKKKKSFFYMFSPYFFLFFKKNIE